MGWKLPIVVTRAEGRTLQQFVDDAYASPRRLEETTKTARDALNPGLLEGFALTFGYFHWIFDWTLCERSIQKPLPVSYPIWMFFLHSVVNGYGFSAQTNGSIIRSRLGDGGDDRITVDIGEPSSTERTFVARFAEADQQEIAWNAWRNTGISFSGPIEEHTTHDLMGEDVVFGLMEELVGFRLDAESSQTDAFESSPVLQVLRPPGFFARLLGRR